MPVLRKMRGIFAMATAGKARLPKGLNSYKVKGNTYWRWYDPAEKKNHNLGRLGRAEAIRQAKMLNDFYEAQVAPEIEKKKVRGKKKNGLTVEKALGIYKKEYLDVVNSGTTHYNKSLIVNIIIKDIGDKLITDMETRDWRKYFHDKELSYHNYQRYKVIISQCYSTINSSIELNLEKTIPNPINELVWTKYVKEPEKIRGFMTLKQFKLLYISAPFWMQPILKFGLITGLRESDILNMKYSQIEDDGYLYVIPEKTKHLDNPRKLKFKITEELKECGVDKKFQRRDCPFIFNKEYERDRPSTQKEHPNQILKRFFSEHYIRVVENISNREWSQYKSQFRNGNRDEKEYPTFHEIRGLCGELLRKELGLTDYEVGKRYGHYDSLMSNATRRYKNDKRPEGERTTDPTYYPVEEYFNFKELMQRVVIHNEVSYKLKKYR